MIYPHRLLLWAPSPSNPGTQNRETGRWTENPNHRLVLYDNDADVQESPRRRAVQESGEPVNTADLMAFLADEWPLQNRNGAETMFTTGNPDVLTIDGTEATILTTGERIRIDRGVFAVITWEDGSKSDAEVLGYRRLDGVVLLARRGNS